MAQKQSKMKTNKIKKSKKEKEIKKMKSSTYFSIIPSGVLSNEKISDGSKITYALILGLSNQYGYCFAPNESLAEMRSTSISSLRRHLKELELEDLIVFEYNHRNDRRMTPNIFPNKREKTVRNQNMVKYTQIEPDVSDALDNIYKKMKVYKKN